MPPDRRRWFQLRRRTFRRIRFQKQTLRSIPVGLRAGRAGQPRRDPTLKHPRCVFQLLKRRYSATTPTRCAASRAPRKKTICAFAICTPRPRSRPRRHLAIAHWDDPAHPRHAERTATSTILRLLLGDVGIAVATSTPCAANPTCKGPRPGTEQRRLTRIPAAPVQADTDLKTYLPQYVPTRIDTVEQRKLAGEHAGNLRELLKAWWGEPARMNLPFVYLPKLGAGFEGQGYAFLALTTPCWPAT